LCYNYLKIKFLNTVLNCFEKSNRKGNRLPLKKGKI